MTLSPYDGRASFPAPPPSLDPAYSLRDEVLADYALEVGQAVEVELLVHVGTISTPTLGPRSVEGAVVDATVNVLILETRQRITTRIPWPAIALIRNAVTPHPATS